MRHNQARIAFGIGMLGVIAMASAALAKPKTDHATRHHQLVKPVHAVQRSLSRQPVQAATARRQMPTRTARGAPQGRLQSKSQGSEHRWTLPGFRVPPSLQEPPTRRAAAPQAVRHALPERDAARTPSARQVHPAAAPRRSVRTSPARKIERTPQAPKTAHLIAHKRPGPHTERTAMTEQVHHANLAVVDSGIDHSRLSPVVAEARRWLGKNPTGRARLWCARFMNFVLERTGYAGTGSDAAKSFASYGRRISRPQYGAIAVLSRKGGGHVGVVTGVDRNGNPILIAGNNGRRQVGISVYPKRRVIAYVMPGSGEMMARRRFASAKPVPSR